VTPQILLAGGVMRIRKIRDEEDARACLAAVRAAGGERTAWAHAHGIDARSLNAWRVAIDRRAAKRRAAAGPKLIELVPSSAPRSAAAARYVLDVSTGRVEFDDACSAETLQRVVRALRAC
jgi:hypothetical protein